MININLVAILILISNYCLGDSLDLSIEFIYDDVKYDIPFYVDFSGNAGYWTWNDDLRFILRLAICEYLNNSYPHGSY